MSQAATLEHQMWRQEAHTGYTHTLFTRSAVVVPAHIGFACMLPSIQTFGRGVRAALGTRHANKLGPQHGSGAAPPPHLSQTSKRVAQ
mmetsp:Transcript_6506/g.17165  ORF Transcript_6506/g.17165 Transcript_6506/m.17165 type:complete len:88 (-) Transcript_6506:207-470(-)